jgi:glycosyltransferase involved in cell wall biosynthesis
VTALSAIICTHNPRPGYFRRVLEALRGQILPLDQWELLIIDNASDEALEGRLDLSWHPRARIVLERELGLACARIRGILESRGDLLVFIDDDNVLDPDYLQAALEIARQRPYLGVWGGSSRAEYEVEPSASLVPYLGAMLAVSEIERDYWANLDSQNNSTPFGAGMCIRRAVAEVFVDKYRRDPLRRALGRRGGSGHHLGAEEDSDLALTALDLRLGTGRFHALRLTHLIPKERLKEDYVVRLHAGLAWAVEIMNVLHHRPRSSGNPWVARLKYAYHYLKGSPLDRRILRASRSAKKEARELIARIQREQKEASPEEAPKL